MNIGEDVRISLRSIRRRPVESLLLILGIALGIGATAAGISMISNSIREERNILASNQYREIVVRAREDSEDMALPAAPVDIDSDVILTIADIRAANDVPDVAFAYVANERFFRLAEFNFGQGRPGGQGGQAQQSGQGQTHGGDGEQSPPPRGDAAPPAGESQNNQSGGGFFDQPIPEITGPKPVLEEMNGFEVSPDFFSAWNLQAAQGSLLTEDDADSGQRLMILGSNLATALFEDGQALDRELLVFRQKYTITGILEPTGTKYDNLAFVPAVMINLERIPAFAHQFAALRTNLFFSVYDSDRLEEAKAQLEGWFSNEYGSGSVAISIPREEVQAAQDRASRLVTVILFLAVAGLLIASVNVSNILLGRAMRKRKNVGILKALGASIRDVFGLFFLEALIIGAGGALLGAGISVAISKLMVATISGGTVISIMLFLGILAAWAVTTSLTVIPAVQASRIPAAEALRYE